MGAVRYPDYGPATVVATALAAGAPWQFALGLSAALGLVLAVLGGLSLQAGPPAQRARHSASRGRARGRREPRHPAAPVRRAAARCPSRARCSPRLGLLAAWVIDARVRLDGSTGLGLTLVAVGCALSAAAAARSGAPGAGRGSGGSRPGAVVGLVLAALA